VLGALAIELAAAMDETPPYAKSKVAHELRGVLADLAEVEVNAANLGLLEGVDL
jgi:hypothetical protein